MLTRMWTPTKHIEDIPPDVIEDVRTIFDKTTGEEGVLAVNHGLRINRNDSSSGD